MGCGRLNNVSDKSLQQLAGFCASSKTLRNASLEITDSELTKVGIAAIQQINPWRVQFDRCRFSSGAIEDWKVVLKRGRIDFLDTDLALHDVARRFGGQCSRLLIYDDHVFFGVSGTDGVLMRIPGVEFGSEEMACFPNLQYIRVQIKEPANAIRAIAAAQPAGHLRMAFIGERPGDFWKMISETPSLSSLYVHRPPAGTPRLTHDHRLEQLTIKQCDKLDEEFFAEVAKLPQLERLKIDNIEPIGAELAPLKQLPNVRELWFDRLTDEALSHLHDMPLEKLVVFNCTDMSESTIAKLKAARFDIWLNRERFNPPPKKAK